VSAGNGGAGVAQGLSESELGSLLRERRVCRHTAAVLRAPGGDEFSTLQVGEVVEIIEETKDAGGHSRCVLSRDGTEGWVPLAVPHGEDHALAPAPSASPETAQAESIVAFVEGTRSRAEAVLAEAEKMIDQCQGSLSQEGPWADAKAKLGRLRSKASEHRTKLDQLKRRAASAAAQLAKLWEGLRQKAIETRSRTAVAMDMKDVAIAVEAAEEKAQNLLEGVKSGSLFKAAAQSQDDSLSRLQEARSLADDAMAALADARALMTQKAEAHEADKCANRSHIFEAKQTFVKLTSGLMSMERKCKTAAEVVARKHAQAAKSAAEQVLQELRAALRRSGCTVDGLFEDHAAAGALELSDAQLGELVRSLPGHGVDPERGAQALRVGLPSGRGTSRTQLGECLQEFASCARSVALTDDRETDANDKGLIRRLEPGEQLEVLERPAVTAEGGAAAVRLRVRAVRDGAEGWVTEAPATGAPNLKPAKKPFVRCASAMCLHTEADGRAPSVRELDADEVLEVLTGPRESATTEQPELHLRVRTPGNSKLPACWITLRDSEGGAAARLLEGLFVCRKPIVITDSFDIHSSSVVRRVSKDELLEIADGDNGEQTDEKAKVVRRRFRARSDKAEGWVTVRGSQGSSFLEPVDTHYVATRRVPLRSQQDAGSAVLAHVEEGSALEAAGSPQTARGPAPRLVTRVRALKDGAVGWAVYASDAVPAPVVPHSR